MNEEAIVFLFVGLGNPGAKYSGNRHNIGFMAVDEIVRRHSFLSWRKKFHADMSEGKLGGEKVLVLKPQTFMNESGRAVGEAVRFHDIDLDRVYVFYDELDLEPGKLRVKKGGGAAGHNGIRSIAAHIGPDFKRVRLGIGHPGEKDFVMPHVLGDFAKSDREWVTKLLEGVADEVELLAEGKDEKFQSKVALVLNPPRPNAPRELKVKD
jgi:peptidyl-tRNA hydrolase, PTH1 family